MSEQAALTCAHVVARSPQEAATAGPFVLRFRVAGNTLDVEAEIDEAEWFLDEANHGERDLAVLRLQEPVSIRPIRLRPYANADVNAKLRIHGYPDVVGRNTSVTVAGPAGVNGRWLQLETAPAGLVPISQGFSGAPVWSDDSNSAVGVVVARDVGSGGSVAFMAPGEWLAETWQPLTELMVSSLEATDYETHWLPRAKGVEPTAVDGGWYFTGRVELVDELVSWLRSDADDVCRVVQGHPGSGKSSVLALIAMLTDAKTAPAVPLELIPTSRRPPIRTLVPINLADRTLSDAVTAVCRGLGLEAESATDAVTHASRLRTDALVVLDGLDQAAPDSREAIARRLLRPLASTGRRTGIRVLVALSGAATASVTLGEALGRSAPRLDLTSRRFGATVEELEEYVVARLLQDQSPAQPTPFRGQPDLAARVAAEVARNAGGNYLVAQIVSRTLIESPALGSTAAETPVFPSTVADAMDDYLAQLGPDRARAEEFLSVLALCEGDGLTESEWLAVTNRRRVERITTDEHRHVTSLVTPFLEQTGDPRRFSIYHAAMAQLLQTQPPAELTEHIFETLLNDVPTDSNGQRRWLDATEYVRTHLAALAQRCGRLPELIDDPLFVLTADPGHLLLALRQSEDADVLDALDAYRRSIHRVANLSAREAAAYIEMSARQVGISRPWSIADERLPGSVPFRTRWAAWRRDPPHTVVADHRGAPVVCVLTISVDDEVVVVSGDQKGQLRRTALMDMRRVAPEVRAHTGGVYSILPLPLGLQGNPMFATGGGDGHIRLWDRDGRRAVRTVRRVHADRISALAGLGPDHIVVSVGIDGDVVLTDLRTPAAPSRRHVTDVPLTALAVITSPGATALVVGDDSGRLHVFDGALRSTGESRVARD